MKDAPFNISLVLMAVLLIVTIAGGIFAVILGALGVTGFFGIFLSAFLTVPLGSIIRQSIAQGAAHNAGVSGNSPMAFSFPVRLLIGAVIAAVISYLFSLSTFYSFGFLMGAVAALLTSVILTLVFFVKVNMSN